MIDRLRTTCWMPPDYWQTDNSNGLVMVICNYDWLNSASRVLISTCSAPLVQTGQRKQFSMFDRDLWPTTLTYNPRLAKVKVDPHAKKTKVIRFKQESTHTHTDATKCIISPTTRSIKVNQTCISGNHTEKLKAVIGWVFIYNVIWLICNMGCK